jgi:parvulin-like peptidyl-prolyl isomerase
MATKATKKEKNAVVKNTPKKGSKSVTSEKGEVVTKNKPNIFKTIWNFVMKHKIIFGIFLIIILIIIFTLLFLKLSLNFTAITINDDKYSKADMNMSLYNLKYNYFGKDASEIPDATLEEQLSSVGMTVSEYLKSETVNELKYRSVIKKIADDNNITLTEEEKEEINSNIKSVINSFGSHGKFKKFLSKNKITEKAYKSYLESDKLYDKVFEELYASGKKNYLTDEEIKKETSNYYKEYYKVNQIVLGIVDTNTLESLTDTVINQKKTLIETILEKAKSGVDFEELVKKYSEEASSDNNLYFTKDDVLEEVYNAVDSLKEDEISEIIKTKYAYSIIKRLKLDDKKLDEYLEKKAKIKFNNDITTKAEDYKVFYENAYKKIK